VRPIVSNPIIFITVRPLNAPFVLFEKQRSLLALPSDVKIIIILPEKYNKLAAIAFAPSFLIAFQVAEHRRVHGLDHELNNAFSSSHHPTQNFILCLPRLLYWVNVLPLSLKVLNKIH
jgi:hypothetical protein